MRFTTLALAALALVAGSDAAVITNCAKKGTYALTFDDGPYNFGTNIRGTLQQYNANATFFVNGYNWDCIYSDARVAELKTRYALGYQIASHTWGHTDITTLTDAQLTKQIDLTETALMKILGVKPRFFRPPYGSYDARTVALLEKRGYKVVTWNIDGGDSAGLSTSAQIKKYAATYRKYPNPYMALNHETYKTTPATIANIVPRLLTAGYKLVTVAECLGVSPYQTIGKPSKKDSTWTCAGTPLPGQG